MHLLSSGKKHVEADMKLIVNEILFRFLNTLKDSNLCMAGFNPRNHYLL